MSVDPSPEVPELYRTRTNLHTFKIIVDEGHTFYVNPYSLAEFSPVFEKLFFGYFKETREQEAQFPDESVTSLSLLLNILKNPFMDIMKTTMAELKDLMRMVNKFNLEFVRSYCEEHMNRRITLEPNMGVETLTDFLELVLDYEHIDYGELKWNLVDRLTEQPITKLVQIKLWEKVKDPKLNNAILKMSIKNCEVINANLHTLVDRNSGSKCYDCDRHSLVACSKCSMYFCDFHTPTSLLRCPGKPTLYKIDRNLFKSV